MIRSPKSTETHNKKIQRTANSRRCFWGKKLNIDEHAKQLGQLLGNFQSLEFILRGFLQALPTARPLGIPYGTDTYRFPIGTELPESELTSYDSLSKLIEKCNAEMSKRGLSGIDPGLVEIRDALAHGRVSSASFDDNLRLLKFDRPVDRKVRVVFNEEMTDAWFAAQKKRFYEAIQLVKNSIKPYAFNPMNG